MKRPDIPFDEAWWANLKSSPGNENLSYYEVAALSWDEACTRATGGRMPESGLLSDDEFTWWYDDMQSNRTHLLSNQTRTARAAWDECLDRVARMTT